MHWLVKRHRQAEKQVPVIAVQLLVPDDERPHPETPTGFYCGSQEKVELMRERYAAGFGIFHESDLDRKVMRALDAWGKRKPWE